MSPVLDELRIQIYADGADLARTEELAEDPRIRGFTTNPTLMRRAGVEDYLAFAKELTNQVATKPISFEVVADDPGEMERQALLLADLAPNVVVKIPITDTSGTSSAPLLARLADAGVSVNATALLTHAQVAEAAAALADGPPAIISVFAGRVADAGVDPVAHMVRARELLEPHPGLQLLWASPREVLNVLQADAAGCHIITLTPDLLAKMANFGRDLHEFSVATVREFRNDALAAGYDF